MDVLPAPEVVEALTEAVRAGDTGYPNFGTTYKEALAEFAPLRWGWNPDPADMALCADVDDRDPGPGRAVLAAPGRRGDPESGLCALRQLHPGGRSEGGGGRAHRRRAPGRGCDRRSPGREPDRCRLASHRAAPVQPAQPDRCRPYRGRTGRCRRVRAASRRTGHRGRGARAAGPRGCDIRAVVRGRRPWLRGHLGGQGVQPRGPQGGPDRRRPGEPRPAQATAGLRGLRGQPSGRDRSRRGLPLGPVLAGCGERQHRVEPRAAGRAPRRPPARGGLPGARRDLPGVAGPARGRPGPGPGRDPAQAGPGRPQRGPHVRARRHRARPDQPRLLAGGAHRGGGPDGGRHCRPCGGEGRGPARPERRRLERGGTPQSSAKQAAACPAWTGSRGSDSPRHRTATSSGSPA